MDRRKFLKKSAITTAGVAFIPPALLSLAGCEPDLLDTTPYGDVSSETMWTTDNLTDMGINGIYNILRNGGVCGNQLYQMDMYGSTTQERDAGSALLTGGATANNGIFTSNWQNLYEGIHRANDAIFNIPEKSPSDEDKKTRYVAEAKFLRAYFYFSLNRLYRGVPIYLEPITDEEAIKGRDSEEDVWKVVIDDLTDCINTSELPEMYASGDANYGHATKGAAYALRGKAYLYQGMWSEAIADFDKVRKIGFDLYPSYEDFFTEANEQSVEMIFSVQNKDEAGYGSDTHFRCGTRSSYGSCWNTYLVTPYAVDLYQNKDGSKFEWNDYLPDYDQMTPSEREVFFLRDGLTDDEKESAADRGADMSKYLDSGNEARLKAAYTDRDPRLNSNVIVPYSSYLGVLGGADHEVVSRWPFRTDNEPSNDLRTDTLTRFFYLHRKYVYKGASAISDRERGPIDFPIIRYADVLLMWAEALCESGNISGAIDKVNEVRSRVNMPGLQQNDPNLDTFVSDENKLRDKIRDERRREFVNEGINFFDELRWGTLEEVVYADGGGLKQCWGENVVDYFWSGDHLYKWAIPQTERERNSSLDQNEGWSA